MTPETPTLEGLLESVLGKWPHDAVPVPGRLPACSNACRRCEAKCRLLPLLQAGQALVDASDFPTERYDAALREAVKETKTYRPGWTKRDWDEEP